MILNDIQNLIHIYEQNITDLAKGLLTRPSDLHAKISGTSTKSWTDVLLPSKAAYSNLIVTKPYEAAGLLTHDAMLTGTAAYGGSKLLGSDPPPQPIHSVEKMPVEVPQEHGSDINKLLIGSALGAGGAYSTYKYLKKNRDSQYL